MTKWFVGRHDAAKDFARANGHADAAFIDHLDIVAVKPGDVVVGILPINLAAAVAKQGGRYIHLALDVPESQRGRELTLDDMERHGARFVEYTIRRRRPPRIRAAIGRIIRHPLRAVDRRVRVWRRWLSERPARLIIVIGLAVLAGFVSANQLSDALPEFWSLCIARTSAAACGGPALWGLLLQASVYGLVYGFAVYLLSRLVSTIIWSRMRPLDGADARCATLIMPMSPLKGTRFTQATAEEAVRRFRPHPDASAEARDYARPTAEYEALERTPDGGPFDRDQARRLALPWQQNVRAVAHHGPLLRRVLVLPSKQGNDEWEHFARFMAAFFPGLDIGRVTREGSEEPFTLRGSPPPEPTYEDYAFVREGLNRGVDQLLGEAELRGEDLAEADICIDATPCQKPCSIGAAIVTLNRDLKLSYVSIDGVVRVFDAQIGTADSLARSIAP